MELRIHEGYSDARFGTFLLPIGSRPIPLGRQVIEPHLPPAGPGPPPAARGGSRARLLAAGPPLPPPCPCQ